MTDVAIAPHRLDAALAVASQWQLMWWAFRRHRLAMVGLGVTIVLLHHRAGPGLLRHQRSVAAERAAPPTTRRRRST